MKIKISIALSLAALLSACGGPAANNAPANNANTTNTNTAKPVAAAPTADTLLALDKQATEAYLKGDKAFFDTFLAEKFVAYEGGHRMTRAEMLGMVSSAKCDAKSWNLEDPQMTMVNADTYVLAYKATVDGSCSGPDGKPMKLPSPTRAASLYIREGDKWKGVYHGETMIIDPTKPPPPPAKAEPKKEEPKKEEAKRDESAKPAAAAPSANTEALVKLHTAGWEAFKAKNGKQFQEMSTSGLSLIDPIGGYFSGQNNVIKHWTETMKCEGITKVGVSDGFSSAISATVEILTLKGTADGTCDGQKNGPLYQTAVYVKEGEAWKLAFMQEFLAM
ncbi:MAG: nuclear transport factor 2 family protein [Pyrinomonadaceae bacterium]